MTIPTKVLRKYVKDAVTMWVNSRDENYQGLGGLEDAVEACSPYDLYTGGFYEVYIGAAVLIRKLVKGGLSPSRSKKGAKP